MNGSRARVALILLNLSLVGAIVYLAQHAVRRVATHAVVDGPLATQFALAGEQGPGRDDPSGVIGAEFDPPLPEKKKDEDPIVKPRPTIETRYRLLLAFENREDPRRSTAIVSSATGEQRTLTIGDPLEEWSVVQIAVEGEGDERRAMLVAERADGERVRLYTERGARP